MTTTVDHVGEDLLQNIVARLPALSFASSACVSRSWNRVCNRVLCRPKLSSACSFNPSLHITAKLGSKVPVITTCSSGIIGRDVFSDEFKEVKWNVVVDDTMEDAHKAIMLMVGFLPGLKVNLISLLEQHEDLYAVRIDKFVTDIREFSTSVSGCESPAAIIMFSDREHHMKAVMKKLDYAMSPETVIVGDSSCYYLRTNGISENITATERGPHVVALVFVMDKNKPLGIGETQFHVATSSGLLSVGPACKVASIEERHFRSSTLLAIRRERSHENLDDETLWSQVYEELAIHHSYVGVTKRRKCPIGQEKDEWMTNFSFHKVAWGDQESLVVNDIDIKVGDTFRIYRPDSTTALSSVANVSNLLRSFKQGSTIGGDKREVFGGLIFISFARGESFFGQPNVDSSPFLDNFPGVTLGGTFCNAFGHGDLTPYVNESQEQSWGVVAFTIAVPSI